MPETSLVSRALAPLGLILDFGGRTRRADFWPYMGLLFAIYVVGFAVGIGVLPYGTGSALASAYLLVAILTLLAFAATVRRLHDVGWSGRWMGAYVLLAGAFIAFFFYWRYGVAPRAQAEPAVMLRLLPLMMIFSLGMNCAGLLVFVVSLLDGTTGANRYGPDPKGRTAL